MWASFREFSSTEVKKQVTLILIRWVCRLPSPRHGHFRSGLAFGICRPKSSKVGRFTFGPMDLSFAVTQTRPLQVWRKFRGLSSKSSKVGNFTFGRMGLSFAFAEIRSFPVWGSFRTFRRSSSKIDIFSFGRMGLSFAVPEVRSIPVWGNFW
jgi:hypothetical protein